MSRLNPTNRLKANQRALLKLAGDPYAKNGDFIESTVYDTLLNNAVNLTFFSEGIGAAKHKGLTNLEQPNQLPAGQAFAVDSIGFRILSATNDMSVTSNTNMSLLMEDLQTCYWEPFLAGKQHMGSFVWNDLLTTWSLVNAAGSSTGSPQGSLVIAESWRKIRVPWKIPQQVTFGVRFVQGDGVDWNADIKSMFYIQCILKGFLARRT